MTDSAASPIGSPESPRRERATIYDIARVAGVSASTVSRALNKPGRISAGTERRIREAAEALGYRINPLARALLTGQTHTLGLILSDITNPVYFELIRGTERVTNGAEFTLVLAESQESPEMEAATIERLMPSVDGFILVASRLSDDGISRVAARKRVALVNRRLDGIASVVPNVEPGMESALRHLRDGGHRLIVMLSGPSTSWMSRLRVTTAFEQAARLGLHIVEIGPNAPTLEGGVQSLPRVLASGATAVLAHNDLMALGLLTACRDAGVAIPAELSIVGCDDILGASLTTPALTTIRTPLGAAGEFAARLLIGGDERPEPRVPLVAHFVERGSTGPAAR